MPVFLELSTRVTALITAWLEVRAESCRATLLRYSWTLDVWHKNYDGAPSDGSTTMFNPTQIVIEAFGNELRATYERTYGLLEQAILV